MVIGVVGWGSVRDWRGGDWRGGGAPSMYDPIDVLLSGESFGAGVAVCGGVVNSFPSAVDLWDSLVVISFIDSPELLSALVLRSPSVPVELVELFCDLNDGSWRLPSPSWNGKSVRSDLWRELGCRLAGLLWGSGRSRGDSYGLVPVYDGGIFCSSPMVWILSWGKEGRVG